MDHRRFLAHPEAHRPFAGGDLFACIGGRAALDTLVDGLYDGIEVDAALLFGVKDPDGRACYRVDSPAGVRAGSVPPGAAQGRGPAPPRA